MAMSIFTRKARAVASPATNEARPLQLLQDASGNRTLAIGMTWRTVMVAGGATVALRMAKEAKATHYCQVDGQVVGYGTLRPKSRKNPLPSLIFPAASVAAHYLGGDALIALHLSESEVWLAFIRAGVPSGTEEIITGTSDLSLDELVSARCRELIDPSPQFMVYTDLDLDLGERVSSVVNFALSQLLDIPPRQTDKLLLTEAKGSFEGLKIPGPVIAMGTVALVLFGGWTGYGQWKKYKAADERAKEAARVAREENPEIVWKAAFAKFRQSTPNPSVDAIKQVRESFRMLPAKWMGWSVKTATCKAADPAGGNQVWACIAHYNITARIGAATNLQLKPTVPAGYTVNFLPTKSLNLTWMVTTHSPPIDISKLPSRIEHLVGTASKIQRLAPAFNEAPTIAFAPVKLDAPRGKRSGTVIPMPATFVMPTSSKLSIKGPLRSVDTILANGLAADWRTMTLIFNESSRADGRQPTGIRQSALQAEITGVLYAKD